MRAIPPCCLALGARHWVLGVGREAEGEVQGVAASTHGGDRSMIGGTQRLAIPSFRYGRIAIKVTPAD